MKAMRSLLASEYTGDMPARTARPASPAKAAHVQEHAAGLLGSLDDLSLRASFFAIGIPLLIVGIWYLAGYGFGEKPAGALPRPLFALAMGSFVLVPMLALAGATTAFIVAASAAWEARPTFRQWLRVLFLVAVGLWALVTAYTWDTAILPAIT